MIPERFQVIVYDLDLLSCRIVLPYCLHDKCLFITDPTTFPCNLQGPSANNARLLNLAQSSTTKARVKRIIMTIYRRVIDDEFAGESVVLY